jgi:DNA-binding response OmpR family regulator
MEEHAQSKGRILLVDHDEEWLNSARSVLVTLGYSVEIARSITEALDLPDMYDLVLMNWAQADQERLLFRRLAQPESPGAPCVVVMFPIQRLPERMRAVFKAGAFDCVDKPFDQSEVVKLVEALQAECVLQRKESA